MNIQTAQALIQLNNDFYSKLSESFSASRAHPWHGWQNLAILNELYTLDKPNFKVFDLACGNLRFEHFLQSELPDANISFYAVDNCDALLPDGFGSGDLGSTLLDVNYQNLDVLQALQNGVNLSDQLTAPACNLSVCFGFMHHVPLKKWRAEILRCLVEQTQSGGYVVFSFWQFLNNPDMAAKAKTTHRRALQELKLPELNSGDYLLGWKDTTGQYRYCHSFSDVEIDQLLASVADKATLVSKFTSDGRTDNLNTYLVLQVF